VDAKQAKLEKKLEDLLRQTAEVFVSVAIHGARPGGAPDDQIEATPSPVISKPGHIHAIGGFRFVAALAVMIGHFRGRFGFGEFHAAFGGRGVSFFFVLSGFILTYVYHARLTRNGILNFYFKRVVRLWPLHLVCMGISIWVIGQNIDAAKIAVNAFLLQSWIPDSNWVFSYNGVSWSISTEMFFFFMFPFLLLGGQRQFWFKFGIVALISVSIVFATQQLKSDPGIASQYDLLRVVHANPLVRLVEFGIGMATAFLFFNSAARRESRPSLISKKDWGLWFDSLKEIVAISSFVLFVFTYDYVRGILAGSSWGGGMFAVWYHFAGSSLVFALIIYVFASSKGILARVMGAKLMNFLGEISYAFFLIHHIVLVYHSRVDWSASGLNRWVLAPCLITMVLGMAIWLHFVIERPVRDMLMSMSQRGFFYSARDSVKQVFKFGFSRTGVICFVLCVGSWLSVRAQYIPLNLTPPMYETIFASNKGVRGTRFGEKMRLMGCDAKVVEGGLELRFVWQKLAAVDHFRFTHVLHKDGGKRVIPPANKSFFKDADLLQPFAETQFIPIEMLEQGQKIGIGFYSPEIDSGTNQPIGSLRMNRRSEDEYLARLIVVQPQSLGELKRQIREFQANTITDVH
jgi:peptidoglycan/LPS O-acetylase OafA/YrhL